MTERWVTGPLLVIFTIFQSKCKHGYWLGIKLGSLLPWSWGQEPPTSKGNVLEGVLFSSEAWGYIRHAMSSTEDHVWLSATESAMFNRENRRHSPNNAIYIQAWMNAGPSSTLHWTPRSSGQVSDEKWFVKKLSRASNLPSTTGILNCYEENSQHGCPIGTPDLVGQAEIFLQIWGGGDKSHQWWHAGRARWCQAFFTKTPQRFMTR